MLVACSAAGPDVPGVGTFVFSIDPAAGTLEPLLTGVAPSVNPERLLEPGSELVVASSKAVFLPGNVLRLELAFKNVSDCTFSNLGFSRSAASSGVVSSREPAPADTTLAPGATTDALQFSVTHTGKPFTYAVQADADVTCAPGPSADLGVNITERSGDPVAKGKAVEYFVNVKNAGPNPATGVKLAVEFPFTLSALPEGCTDAGNGKLTCTLGSVPVDGSKGVTLKGTATEEGTFAVTAKVSANESDPRSGNNSDSEQTTVNVPAEVCTSPVNIPDKALESAIRNKLNKPTGDLTCDNLKSLTKLNADVDLESEDDPAIVSSLQGLQFATNLTSLSLNDNNISDLSPLKGLTKLTTLELNSNNVDNLSPLSGLTGLTRLVLYGNKIADLSPLTGLTNLLDLQVGNNRISDVEPLRNLTKLDILDLYFNEVESIGALVANTGLGYGDDFIDLGNNCLSAQGLQDASTLDARSSSNFVDVSSQREQCSP